MSGLSEINLCNCFAIRQAARFVSQLYERHFGGVGVTSSQFSILVHVHTAGTVGMLELAEAMMMDRTTLVRAIQPLQRDGYLVSQPEGKGSRKLLLTLTPRGRAKLSEAAIAWQAAQDEYTNLVGAERANVLRETLLSIPALAA